MDCCGHAAHNAATCEAPSSPQCFRTNSAVSVYTCEWSTDTTESNQNNQVYFRYGNLTRTVLPAGTSKERISGRIWSRQWFREEELFVWQRVHIWVIARAGNFSCTSPTTSVILNQSVKYEAPKNISVSWMGNDLNLSWRAEAEQQALAEVSFQMEGDAAEPWENKSTTTNNTDNTYQVIVVNLQKDSSYRVQVRHQSIKAPNPLWSGWSSVTVPAELEHPLEVNMRKKCRDGTQTVTLTWQPVPPAAAVGGVTYSIEDTQRCHGCPCYTKNCFINTTNTKYTTFVTYSAANISVIAWNAAGKSPPAVVHVRAKPAADLKPCEKTLLGEKLGKQTCLEWYELEDGHPKPESVLTLLARTTKAENLKMKAEMKDHVRYLYIEHRCVNRRPQTVQMCLFYKTEGAPISAPEDFITFSETHTSAYLSWRAIPTGHQRGFLTHYVLCRANGSWQNETKECRNISASLLKYRLEHLTPGAKYNISLASVTRAGEGPAATVIINTVPQKHSNVLLSLGLLLSFSFLSVLCTFTFKRVKNRILPPVPTPVIPDSAKFQPEHQEILQGKEVVHKLTLCQLPPEGKSTEALEASEETTFLGGTDGVPVDTDDDKSDESGVYEENALRCTTDENMTDLEQVENEIAMLIYRNGLVFDVKTDSG
ncbi:leukemia inhibitory factor receptor isoform X2 [Genypterus blacodes]|uniref:leukemia inhibitory factor receptor isoform X2 n=1 Tax=Genypterus blacodes TaxID=154954 RepID=UPI003F77672D